MVQLEIIILDMKNKSLEELTPEEITREVRELYNGIVKVFDEAGIPVIYGDTDSIYIQMVNENNE